MAQEKKGRKDQKKRISLDPLSFEEAVTDILQVKPESKQAESADEDTQEQEDQDKDD